MGRILTSSTRISQSVTRGYIDSRVLSYSLGGDVFVPGRVGRHNRVVEYKGVGLAEIVSADDGPVVKGNAVTVLVVARANALLGSGFAGQVGASFIGNQAGTSSSLCAGISTGTAWSDGNTRPIIMQASRGKALTAAGNIVVAAGMDLAICGWHRGVSDAYVACNGVGGVAKYNNYYVPTVADNQYYYLNTLSDGANNTIYFSAYLIGLLSPDECDYMSSCPWQIFKPISRRIYFDVGAGGTAGAVLEGAASGAASASGALTTGIPIAGAALSVATASGALSVGIPLSGAAASMSSASGTLTAQITLSGAALAQAVSSALLSTGIVMTADAVATAAAQGTLVTAIQLLGGAQAQAGGSGSLTTSTGGLEGNAQASASAAASLSTQIRLSGVAIAQAGASGSLGGAVNLAGAALSTASANGELTVTIALTAQALAQAIAQGSMTTSILLDADAAAQAQAGAQLSGGSAFVIPAARSARVVTGGRRPAAIQTTSRR